MLTAIWGIFFIPSVQTSIYFHRKDVISNEQQQQQVEEEPKQQLKFKSAFSLIWTHFKTSYTNETVLVWCTFYTLSFCLYFQITAYIQVLWLAIDDDVFWNPTVDGTLTLLSALAMLIAGKIQIAFLQKQTLTMLVLIIMSLLQGVFIFFAATSQSLLACYINYVIYGVCYGFCITICATKIAENIGDDSHGLIFGFNTFIALSIQTCLTLIVVSNGFKLSPVGQFVTYSMIYIALGMAYAIKFAIDLCR